MTESAMQTQLSQDQLEVEESLRAQKFYSTALVSSRKEPPSYGHRKGRVPHSFELTEKTRPALNKQVSQKIAAAMPVRAADKQAPAQYIRYTPSQQGVAFNPAAEQKEEMQDQREPIRFKINKKIPQGPHSPPACVMRSPSKKMTVQEQQQLKFPPCISNWKNAKVYIPVDKRLATDGRGLQTVHIKDNFAKHIEVLDIAAMKAKEAVELRAQVEKKMAQKEKKKEEKLRNLAQMARDGRAGIKSNGDKGGEDDEAREREEIRHDRRRERQHKRSISKAAPYRRFVPRVLWNQSRTEAGRAYPV